MSMPPGTQRTLAGPHTLRMNTQQPVSHACRSTRKLAPLQLQHRDLMIAARHDTQRCTANCPCGSNATSQCAPVKNGMTSVPPPTAVMTRLSFMLSITVFTNDMKKNKATCMPPDAVSAR